MLDLDLHAGESLFIAGASGAVGTFAIQLAAKRGVRVAGSASEANLDYMESLGADKAVDYNDPAWPDEIRKWAGGGVDAALAIQPDTEKTAIKVVRDGGRVVAVSAYGKPQMQGERQNRALVDNGPVSARSRMGRPDLSDHVIGRRGPPSLHHLLQYGFTALQWCRCANSGLQILWVLTATHEIGPVLHHRCALFRQILAQIGFLQWRQAVGKRELDRVMRMAALCTGPALEARAKTVAGDVWVELFHQVAGRVFRDDPRPVSPLAKQQTRILAEQTRIFLDDRQLTARGDAMRPDALRQ